MPTRTLYVSDEDEVIWEQARNLASDRPESLSRLATEGLRALIDERRAAAEAAQPAEQIEDAAAVARFARELRALGWERAGKAFTRACLDYGAARSRAKRKADDTLGAEGRQVAARKASATKGDAGRSAAAQKAHETRKSRAARTK